MSVTIESSGTQIATIGVEHSLVALTQNRSYQLVVDLANLAAGDSVTLRAKRKVLTGGTIRTWLEETFTGAQSAPVVISIPFGGPYGTTLTLQQNTGTGRSFDWSAESIA